MMKKCPFCGADIEESARFCLYCMQSLTEKKQIQPHKKEKKRLHLLVWVAITALLLIAVILFIVQGSSENTTPSNEPQPNSVPLSSVTEPADTPPVTEPADTAPVTEPTDTAPVTEPTHTHSYTVKNTKIDYKKSEATCTSPAVYYYSCNCGECGSETFTYGSMADHTVVLVEGYPATCISEGLSDSWYCSTCGEVFFAQQVLPIEEHYLDPSRLPYVCPLCQTYPPHNHLYTEEVVAPEYLYYEASCIMEAAYYYSCPCGAKSPNTIFSDGDLGEHTVVYNVGYPATCTEAGLTDSSYCSYCEEVIISQASIPPLGHTFELGDPSPTCIICKAEGVDVVIIASELPPILNNGKYRINSCTYTVRDIPLLGTREIVINISYTNLTASPSSDHPSVEVTCPHEHISKRNVKAKTLEPGETGEYIFGFYDKCYSKTYYLTFI